MMDTKEMQGKEECGGCGGCGHGMGCHGHARWARILVKVLVMLFVFWAGIQLGELKGILYAEYGNYGYGMMGGLYDGRGQAYGPGMMGEWSHADGWQSTTTKSK
ncbi:MAG: hypothetical protein KGH56_02595 [Patescibacteria group bacterium]|nr:hypothetical protein [Patescibacteria group bacterium]